MKRRRQFLGTVVLAVLATTVAGQAADAYAIGNDYEDELPRAGGRTSSWGQVPVCYVAYVGGALGTSDAPKLGATYYWRIDEVNAAPFEPVEIPLGEVAVGTSRKVVVSVTNVGDEVLALDAVLAGDECLTMESGGPGSVSSMQIAEIELLFTPRNAGNFGGVLEISGEAVMTLTGTGVPPTQGSAQATVTEIGAAVSALEEALAAGTLDADEALALMAQLTDRAGKIAFDCVIDNEQLAVATTGADADLMIEALAALEAGELLRLAGAYSQAVAMYDCAVALAGSVASDPIDPLGEVQTDETTPLVGEGRKGPCATSVVPS